MHGEPSFNDNCQMLINICDQHELKISNTFVQLEIHNGTNTPVQHTVLQEPGIKVKDVWVRIRAEIWLNCTLRILFNIALSTIKS